MLHNNGPCGSNVGPEHLDALVSDVSLDSSQNLADNLGKTAQQPMHDASGRYYLPDFASYNHSSINLSSQSSPQHSYSPMEIPPPFSLNHTRSIPNNNWQNGLLPPQAFYNQNMLNYAALYDRNHENLVQNQYTNSIRNIPINIPQVPVRTFEKVNNDPNCSTSNYNESCIKTDNTYVNSYQTTKSHEKPLLDNVKRKSLENTVRLIEDMLSNTAKTKEAQKKQFLNQILNNSSHNLTHQDKTPISTLTSQCEDNSNEILLKKQEIIPNTTDTSRNDNISHTSFIQQENLNKSLKNQEKVTDVPEKSTPQDKSTNVNNKTNTEIISKKDNFHEKHNSNLVMESYDNRNSSNNGRNTSNNNSGTETIDKPNRKKRKESKQKTNDNTNKEGSIERENSTDIPFVKVEVEAYESENGSQNSDTSQQVEVKVESNLWPELEDMTIFQCDVNGKKLVEIGSANVFSGEESLVAAKEAISNATQEPNTYYECINCSLLVNHPKRYLIHHKWHSFGLTNERRMEIAKDRQLWRDQRKQARMVTKKIVKELTAPESWDCDQCDKQFPNKAGLKNHRERYHPTRTYECELCKIQILGYRAYKSHTLVHKANKGPTHQCPVCNKKFVYAHTLKKHRGTHMEKTLQCPNCPKLFATAYHLNVHQKVHERAERGTTYRCSYCAKGFYEAYNLNVHERTHRNEKPFKCDICNSAYGSSSSLKRHLKVSHSTSKPFECTICHRCFATQSTRDRHEIREHGNPEQMQFACELCDKRYMYQRDLTKHVYKTHKNGNRKKISESE